MRTLITGLLPAIMMTMSSVAFADPDKDESGHGRKDGRRAQKVEFWDGNCKVERKFEKNGGYKEERKCKGPQYQAQPVYVPAPVYVEPGGVVLQGTVRVR